MRTTTRRLNLLLTVDRHTGQCARYREEYPLLLRKQYAHQYRPDTVIL